MCLEECSFLLGRSRKTSHCVNQQGERRTTIIPFVLLPTAKVSTHILVSGTLNVPASEASLACQLERRGQRMWWERVRHPRLPLHPPLPAAPPVRGGKKATDQPPSLMVVVFRLVRHPWNLWTKMCRWNEGPSNQYVNHKTDYLNCNVRPVKYFRIFTQPSEVGFCIFNSFWGPKVDPWWSSQLLILHILCTAAPVKLNLAINIFRLAQNKPIDFRRLPG